MIFNRKPIFLLIFLGLSVCLFQSCFPNGKFLFVFNRASVKKETIDSLPKKSFLLFFKQTQKRYPSGPFVFANEIKVAPGIVAKDEQNRLETELSSYWDDSVRAREIQQFGIFYRIKDPQHFDTFALDRSRLFMNSYLQSQGYYNAALRDTFRIDTFKFGSPKQQFRAVPIMNINPGKRLTIDSVNYNFLDTANPALSDTVLQQVAMQRINQSLLKKGDPYSKQIIGAELDRLVNWYRQNGFYRLTREQLVAYVDTTDQLIDSLTIDPFELVRRITEASERRRQNPTADIEVLQAKQVKIVPVDTIATKQFRIGDIYYYPQTADTANIDSLLTRNYLAVRGRNNVYMKYPANDPMFNFRPLYNHTYLTKGELYNERLFFKTINAFGQMGPWKQVEIRDSLKGDTVDFHLFMMPYKKLNLRFSVDLTRSTGDFVSSNNLFGLGGNVTITHRNLFKNAIQAAFSPRAGVELNLDKNQQLLQTVQGGLGLSFAFQNRFLQNAEKQKVLDAARGLVSFNASYTERKDFYRLRSLIMNFGDEWVKGSLSQTIRPVNVELYSLDVLPLLDTAFKTNPFLRTAFNTGNVVSTIYTRSYTRQLSNTRSYNFRFGGEYAGWPILAVNSLKQNLYHYIKVETEFIYKTQGLKSAWVYRGFMGLGYNLLNDPTRGKTLPFFKQFVAGGPNSMRAWGLRQLGLGSSLLSETAKDFRDRFGDFQLELNIENRFQLVDLGSAKFSSAVFMDVGNIWNLKEDPANPLAKFKFGRLYDDMAVALGIGLLRVNVANFIFRVDFALKAKDPARREYGGWLNPAKFTWKNENDRNNYAFQIGIGLPF